MTEYRETEQNMKHNLKRILPILLAIIVICSVVWYLFVYDRDFTRDLLVQQARYFENQGEHSLAAWFYNQAYVQSGEDETVAIELAEQFKSIGNYTKAEHTLASAIADGGSVDLYIALCKTYVEQDKLKDAVTMLDNVGNPEIKAQLDTLRPSAPTASHESGFYNQYITVTVENTSGKLYLTADGTYPSTEAAAADSTVTTVGGENSVYALAVDENGLVSPLSYFSYTIGGVIEQIVLSDSSIDALVRQQLQMGADEPLFTSDLWELTALVMPADAQSSADLAFMPYLQTLTAENSTINGWTSLSSLTQLTELTFRNCLLSAEDLLAIASLPRLEKLTLSNCGLSSIANLSGAKKLTYLDLSNNAVRDLTPIAYMTGLQYLDLNHNALDNLSALSSLSALQTLDVSYNSLISLAPLSSCVQLKELNAGNNSIASLSGIGNLAALLDLNVSYNALTDASMLSTCTALTDLDISNNTLSDISALSALASLEYLNFSRNTVTALPAWDKSCALVTIDGSYNKVTTVSGLAGFANLNNVLMNYNSISSVDALSGCSQLVSVSVEGNPVRDVSVLKNMGVIVSYTPRT